MRPTQDPGLLPEMPLCITSCLLIVADVWLLKIIASAHQQQLENISVSGMPVELRRRARTFPKVVKFVRLRRIKEPTRGESIHEEVISQPTMRPSVVGIQVVITDSRAAKIHISMPAKIGP